LQAYRDSPAGRVTVGPDARISQLLARPSPGSTVCDLLAQIVTSLNVDGNVFIGKWRGADGGVVQLVVFDPGMCTVRLKGQVVTYTVLAYGGVVETGPSDILHIKSSVSIDHLRGVSPITQYQMAMGLNASLQASAKAFVDQGSRPSTSGPPSSAATSTALTPPSSCSAASATAS
jgi:phage portal protein BeeE